MEQVPQPSRRAKAGCVNRIEQIVKDDYGETEDEQPAHRQMNKHGHPDHADAKDPQNEQKDEQAS